MASTTEVMLHYVDVRKVKVWLRHNELILIKVRSVKVRVWNINYRLGKIRFIKVRLCYAYLTMKYP